MIVALEGPDRCGKSTLWKVLQENAPDLGVWVPKLPLSPALMRCMSHVEQRQAALWSHLHVPQLLYVCDRHVSVSAPVYDLLFGRERLVRAEDWKEHVRVVYLDVPTDVLVHRNRQSPDEFLDPAQYDTLRRLYDRVLLSFVHARFDGTRRTEELTVEVLEVIRTWRRAG